MTSKFSHPSYPLSERQPGSLKTPSGLAFDHITLAAALSDEINMEDLRVTAEALELQAAVAEEAGRRQLADNFRRAAELVSVPQEKILEIYSALRPGRATQWDLVKLAEQLENEYEAVRCGKLIREAIEAYFGESQATT